MESCPYCCMTFGPTLLQSAILGLRVNHSTLGLSATIVVIHLSQIFYLT